VVETDRYRTASRASRLGEGPDTVEGVHRASGGDGPCCGNGFTWGRAPHDMWAGGCGVIGVAVQSVQKVPI
jgi:hypothetical protein